VESLRRLIFIYLWTISGNRHRKASVGVKVASFSNAKVSRTSRNRRYRSFLKKNERAIIISSKQQLPIYSAQITVSR